jgi:hypothetical protein
VRPPVKSPRCPGDQGHKPYAELANGWPYGRVKCNACGTYAFVNGDGTLRVHVAAAKNAFEVKRDAELEAAR